MTTRAEVALNPPALARNPFTTRLEQDPAFHAAAFAAVHLGLLYLAKASVFARIESWFPASGLETARLGFYVGFAVDALGDVALFGSLWLWLSCAAGIVWKRPCSRRLLGGLAWFFVPPILWSVTAAVAIRLLSPPPAPGDLAPEALKAAIEGQMSEGAVGLLLAGRPAAYVVSLGVCALVFARISGVGRARALAATGGYAVLLLGAGAVFGIIGR